jgi:hypothetical protein
LRILTALCLFLVVLFDFFRTLGRDFL